jgi:triacylglycerol lipase
MNSSLILNQPGFVLANARVLAQYASAAYSEVRDQRSEISNAATDTHVVMTEHDDCTVIAFRGTKDLRNWITDAEFQKQKLGKQKAEMGSVHAGFLAAVESVMPALTARLTGSSGQRSALSLPIVLTGHSLGGALAVLGAFLLAQQGFPVHSIYTFGQPRVGDRAFAAAYNGLSVGQAGNLLPGADRLEACPTPTDRLEACPTLGGRTFRVVNQNDIVPRLPGWLLGYRHCGQLEFITT